MLSVVVAVHNAREYLELCLQSLVAHSKHLSEIVLVDDASSEETRSFIDGLRMDESLPIRLIKTRNPAHSWTNHSWNMGVQLATQPFVALVNSDVIVEENWDTPLIELLSEGFDCACPYLKTTSKPIKLLPYIEAIDPHMLQGSAFMFDNPRHLYDSPFPIPDFLTHWYGDRYLADYWNSENGIGFAPESLIAHAISKSSPQTPEYKAIISKDLINYENYTDTEETKVREHLGLLNES